MTSWLHVIEAFKSSLDKQFENAAEAQIKIEQKIAEMTNRYNNTKPGESSQDVAMTWLIQLLPLMDPRNIDKINKDSTRQTDMHSTAAILKAA